jgi:hypothetical protein
VRPRQAAYEFKPLEDVIRQWVTEAKWAGYSYTVVLG